LLDFLFCRTNNNKYVYAIGYDIGSSSIKAALVELSTGVTVKTTQHPKSEMPMIAIRPGWAEQNPEDWWTSLTIATQELFENNSELLSSVKSIGISYQMHGLVCVDKNQKVLRPSIIWCDSRAVEIGNTAMKDLGVAFCLSHLMNSPGNFTASKLRWIKQNEPETYEKIDKIMLPGDYIAMRLTGETSTTVSSLSEGILWDFKNNRVSKELLEYYEIPESFIPRINPTFSIQGKTSENILRNIGIPKGVPVSYRAGDQPNNALSLGVFQPGDVAATGGTSGVVYGISDTLAHDSFSRVNGFAHVNHTKDTIRIGQLLCINGAGSQYAWIRQQMADENLSYSEMENALSSIPVGSEGLRILPFGNGAERMINNKMTGAQINNLQFNIHKKPHFYRAALEGIAFSFVYGIQILKELGIQTSTMKVGNDNLFQSTAFATTIANLLNCDIQMIETTGAIGAAKASGIAIGQYATPEEAISTTPPIKTYYPENGSNKQYKDFYGEWLKDLKKLITS